MAGVAKDEHPLAGQIRRIDRARIPGQLRALFDSAASIVAGNQFGRQLQVQGLVQLPQERHGGADADRHRFDGGHAETALQPAAQRGRHLGVEADVGVGPGDRHQVCGPGSQRRHHRHVHAIAGQQACDFAHVIAAAKAQAAGAQQVDPRPPALGLPAAGVSLGRARWRQLGFQQVPHQLIEGFSCAPVLFFGIGRQLQVHHRDTPQVHAGGQGTGLVLDQLGGAAFAHQQGLGLEALDRLGDRAFHQLGRVASQIPRLKGGVRDGRPPLLPLDHREQQIGVGVALGCVQHVVHALHRVGDAQGAHMGRPFVGPEGQFHVT